MGNKDGAPDDTLDFSTMPDAIPRVEPLSKTGNPDNYVVNGKRYYVLKSSEGFNERGIASWYGTKFHGRNTSSGEPYDMYAMTAAHKNLPIPSYVKVTNLDNGRDIVVRVNDRGPFVDDRIIDLSYAAAKKLDITTNGTAPVSIAVIIPPHSPAHAENESIAANNTVGKTLYIQIGAFKQRDNAEKLANQVEQDEHINHLIFQLAASQAKVFIDMNEQAPLGGPLYKVRLGPFGNNKVTRDVGDMLWQQGFTDAFVLLD